MERSERYRTGRSVAYALLLDFYKEKKDASKVFLPKKFGRSLLPSPRSRPRRNPNAPTRAPLSAKIPETTLIFETFSPPYTEGETAPTVMQQSVERKRRTVCEELEGKRVLEIRAAATVTGSRVVGLGRRNATTVRPGSAYLSVLVYLGSASSRISWPRR